MAKLLGLHSLDGVFAAIKAAIAEKSTIGDVSASVTTDSSGVTSVSANFADGDLSFTFKNIKGDPLTFDELTTEQKAELKGETGAQGATGVYDSSTQDFLTTLETTTGVSQTKTMTQNAITKELLPITKGNQSHAGKDVGFLKSNGEINTTSTSASSYRVTDYIMLEDGQENVHIVSGVWKPGQYTYLAFYGAMSEESFVSYVNTGTNSAEVTNKDFEVPNGAKYYRLTVKPDAPAIISFTGSLIGTLDTAVTDVSALKTSNVTLTDAKEQHNYDLAVIKPLLNVNTYAVRSAEQGALGSIGQVSTASAVKSKGVSDYIPVSAGDSVKLVSGFYQGSASNYMVIAFYTDTDYTFISAERASASGDVSNQTFTAPTNSAYMRVTLSSNSVYGKIIINTPSDIPALRNKVDTLVADKFEIQAQIRNNPLPIKTSGLDSNGEELNILFLGSSYGVDTIDALVDICYSVGLKVRTYDCYKSGGTMAQYVNIIDNDLGTSAGDYTVYTRAWNQEGLSHINKSVNYVLTARPWDIVIFDDNYARQPAYFPERNADFTALLRRVKQVCTNPRVVFALNSSWTFKDNMNKQNESFMEVIKDMKYTGIDLIIPSGAAICYLRQEADVNNGNNIYRDDKHLDTGVGRFSAAAAAYFALVYPVYGVNLSGCDLTGAWDEAGIPAHTYPTIEVTDNNRPICIACAWKANANRFLLSEPTYE